MGSKDICAILRACHTAGVSKLHLGDLLVEFDASSRVDNSTDNITRTGYAVEDPEAPREEPMLMTSEQRDNFDEIARTRLLMEDPIAYENGMIDELLLEN